MINLRTIKTWAVALVTVASIGGTLLTVAAPQTAYAADACNTGFLGFPAWYRGLTKDTGTSPCDIKSPTEMNTATDGTNNGLSNFIWTIALNGVEIALVVVAYIAGVYFLYGGFLFIVSQGKPESAAKARITMVNALMGLVISIAAVTLVNFIIDGVFLNK